MQSGESRGQTIIPRVWEHTNRAVTILFHSLDRELLASLSDQYWRAAGRNPLAKGALYRGWESTGVEWSIGRA